MKIAFGALPFFLAVAASAQTPQASMSNEWDVRKTLASITTHAERLAPFLEQVQPENWAAGGAPGGYVTQAKSSRSLLQTIIASSQGLNRDPEKLSEELELLFHIRTLESMLGSLSEGIRKYKNPAMADLLNSAVAENAGNRDRLQGYILELARAKEQEFHVADQEAQRCRQSLSRDRAAPAKREPK